jgi:hypothetical protein
LTGTCRGAANAERGSKLTVIANAHIAVRRINRILRSPFTGPFERVILTRATRPYYLLVPKRALRS